MNKIKLNGKDYYIKSEWSELSRDEMITVFSIRGGTDVLSALQKLAILKKLSDLSDRLIGMLTPDQAHRILNLVRWTWKDRLKDRPFDFLMVCGKEYYLPSDGFTDTSAGEIAMFNIYNLQFLKTESLESKQELFFTILAQLCRPKRKDLKRFKKSVEWNGDIREPYNSSLAEEYAEKFKYYATTKKRGLPEMMAVYEWLMVMNNAFLDRNKEIFSEGNGVPVFQGGEGWIALLEDVAGMAKFGDFDKVFDMNGPSLFLHVRMAQKRAKAIEFSK